MSAARTRLQSLADERGSVIVVAGIVTLVIVLLATVIIEVGQVMIHRRHLQAQTDAAALAAALEFPLCTTAPDTAFAAMSAVADQYGGFGGAASYNQQFGTGTYGGTVASVYQSRDYPPGGKAHAPDPDNIFNGDTTTLTCGDPSVPNSPKMFDVKATDHGIKNVFDFGILSTVHAHSRVELKAVNEEKGLLPLAVPDVRPKYVFAKFVAESGTISCTDQSNAPVPSCEEQLTKGAVTNNQQSWVPIQELNVKVPTSDLGVRIRLVGGSDPTAQCGQLYVECYDSGSTNGLVHIRGWDTTVSAPFVHRVDLQPGTCSPDAYFAAADCSLGIQADINLNATVTGTTAVWATVDGGNTKYPLAPAATGGSGVVTWTTTALVPITGGGPHTIALGYNAGNGNKSFGVVQRAFVQSPDRSGPLSLLEVYEGNGTFGPYSYAGGSTHSLGVTVQTLGNLLLSQPSDPPIYLRVFNDSGSASQNQSINCDPNLNNLRDELANGCAPWYKTQQQSDPGYLTCPYATKQALWASPQPWTCAAIATGATIGQISQGLNLRIFGDQNPANTAAVCNTSPVNWIKPQYADPANGIKAGFDETKHPDDKRVLPLFVTPLGTFSGTGQDVVPLIDFGYFYVTGYKGDPCEGIDQNQDPVPNNRGSYVRGHFVKFFTFDNHRTTDDNCDLTTITPCVGVLTR